MAKEAIKAGVPAVEVMQSVDLGAMSLGMKSGSLGEVSVVALLLGFVWLLVRRVISWHIPVCVLGSMALFSTIAWVCNPAEYMSPMFHLLSGGAVLGAVYMATDYVTSPMTKKGMVIYGVGIGVITMLIRLWGPYPEGMSFAILIMNSVVPLIDKYVRPKRFGAPKRVK
jgi:electron transport complex protein RnfD